jgi:hypothetical protein
MKLNIDFEYFSCERVFTATIETRNPRVTLSGLISRDVFINFDFIIPGCRVGVGIEA